VVPGKIYSDYGITLIFYYFKFQEKLTLPYLINIPSPSLTLPGATCPSLFQNFNFKYNHLMPDDLIKKSPKFGKINFGTAIAH
jgi:hypothetical protein